MEKKLENADKKDYIILHQASLKKFQFWIQFVLAAILAFVGPLAVP